ncbi:hypothetical protein [Sporosarcina sp. FSL K6-1508]|uniref:hypothetical protein n=1 Tax=Sporosarcina sp. FSL K6-1508 TaxID=2921553 RepID=UPI0030FC87CE
MENYEVLHYAIEALESIRAEDAEIVQMENTKYDDGSVCFTVSVTFPAKIKVKEDGNEESSGIEG